MRHREQWISRGVIAVLVIIGASFTSAVWSARATSPASSVQTGALIWVAPESPYYEAGLRTRDLITTGNGIPIRNDADFHRVFAATTDTSTINVEGLRTGKPFRATVPAYLPADVTVSGYGWDWMRYLQYYAPDPNKPNPDLRRGYEYFDRRSYPQAQVSLTSATASGFNDPLTLTKVAWLLLSRYRTSDDQARIEKAGALLKQAEEAFDATRGDKDTESKLHGTLMVYYRRAGNVQLAGVHGRRAISCAPDLVGNRLNYYQMLMAAKSFPEAAMATAALAKDFPRSVQFQRLKKNAHIRAGQIEGVIEACEALVDIMPDDVATRLQLLPYLNQIADNFNLLLECDRLLNKKGSQLTNLQKAEVHYYQAQVHYRRKDCRKAQNLARQAVNLRGHGNDYLLMADILHDRRKWREAVIAYRHAQQKGAMNRSGADWRDRSPSQWRAHYKQMQNRMDESIEHLWSWQVKKLPDDVKPFVLQRKAWLKEREVLKHSFVMRNRYEIRNALIVVGVLMILAGVVLKIFVSEY